MIAEDSFFLNGGKKTFTDIEGSFSNLTPFFFSLKTIGKNFAPLLGVESKICKNVLLKYIHCSVTAWAECPTFLWKLLTYAKELVEGLMEDQTLYPNSLEGSCHGDMPSHWLLPSNHRMLKYIKSGGKTATPEMLPVLWQNQWIALGLYKRKVRIISSIHNHQNISSGTHLTKECYVRTHNNGTRNLPGDLTGKMPLHFQALPTMARAKRN